MEEITVKIIKAPYLVGDDVFCDVRIWGDTNRDNIFRLKIGKTLWHSLHKELVMRFELGGNAGEEIDSQLECIVRKVITIRAVPDISRSYVDKSGKTDSPKIFKVQLREDLEDVEIIGGSEYNEAVNRELINNRSCRNCVATNIELVNETSRKEKEKEENRKKKEKIAEKITKKINGSGW